MIGPGKIEIRNHRDFSEARVTGIMAEMLNLPELEDLRSWRVTYRGKAIHIK